MKKSFMTRVLAAGLSVAMAFSLSAATNVTTASAAVKKSSTTTFMKVASKSVTEGKTVTTYMNSTATKKYRIKSHTESSVAKKYISVVMTSSRKGLKITAKEGALAAANLEKKGVNVKINFAAAKSVSAVKKAKATKYVNLKVAVNAAEKPVEKQSIVSAAATGVKTVTLTMAKDVASVESPVAITVKKGTADRACKATAEGKTIKLAMDAKLTQGAYTVSITGLEDTALTADFNVEKDETLTSFEISDNLVARSASVTTVGTIKFAALNQYGEKMVSNDPTVTCSFGKVGDMDNDRSDQKPKKSATASAQGVIEVWDINAVLAIPGTKGTVVLVGDGGVTATKEVSYNTFAKATKGEIIGTYHVNSATMKSMKENDKIEEYELLMKFTNQYDEVMSADDLDKTLTVTISGGLTNINVNLTNQKLDTRTYNGEDYIAVKLKGNKVGETAAKGDATVIVTNNFYGMLINEKLTVSENIVIKNMTITAPEGIYEKQDNVLAYEFVDANGNAVTSYADVIACKVNFGANSPVRIERAADGKAKLIYDGTKITVSKNATTDKASMPVTITGYANSQTGGEYLVKTFTLTAYQERYVKGVTGLKDGVSTSISYSSLSGNTITIKNTDILLADQYSNKVTSDEKFFNKHLADGIISGTTTGTSVYVATNGAFEYRVVNNEKIVATAKGVGTATVYLKYKYDDKSSAKAVEASATNYDAKFTINAFDTKGVDVSTLVIDSINSGDDVTTTKAAILTEKDVVVKATVGGVKTVIPESQYVIVKKDNATFSKEDDLKGTNTKTATLTVQVTTWDSANTPIETVLTKEFTLSRAKSKLFKVTGATDVTLTNDTISGNNIVTAAAATFEKQFTFKDQYGTGGDGMAPDTLANQSEIVGGGLDRKSVTYHIDMVQASTGVEGYTITSNDTYNANIRFTKAGTYIFKVTVKAANGSTKTAKFMITVTQ